MIKRNIIQKDVKWVETDNETATRTTYHGYYGSKRKVPYIGNEYESNRALCNKKKGISEDGESFLSIDQMNDDGLQQDKVCKSCLKIYNKLTN